MFCVMIVSKVPLGTFLALSSVTYLKPVNEQQRIRVDRQVAIADISHRRDRHECQAYGDHAVSEESALKHVSKTTSHHIPNQQLLEETK